MMKESRKIEIYRQIQYRLDQKEQPMPRDVGLTEKEFRELADGTQFGLEKLEEGRDDMSNYVIVDLKYDALALLAKYPDPLSPVPRTESLALPKSASGVLLQGVWKKLRGLFWALLLALITGYITYRIGFNRGQSMPASQTANHAGNAEPQLPATNGVAERFSAQESAIGHPTFEERHDAFLLEMGQRITNHYNSPEEADYRAAVSNRLEWQHQEIMAQIQVEKAVLDNGGDYPIELERAKEEEIRIHYQMQINDLKAEHDLREAQWQQQEDDWRKKRIKEIE